LELAFAATERCRTDLSPVNEGTIGNSTEALGVSRLGHPGSDEGIAKAQNEKR
jgi:hypothetical protein